MLNSIKRLAARESTMSTTLGNTDLFDLPMALSFLNKHLNFFLAAC